MVSQPSRQRPCRSCLRRCVSNCAGEPVYRRGTRRYWPARRSLL